MTNPKSSSTNGGILRSVAAMGSLTIWACRQSLGAVGGMYLLLKASMGNILKGIFVPSARIQGQSLIFQMVRVGVRAIPIVILCEIAIGMILPLQMYPKLDEFGQGEQIATINAIAAFRELGPLLTAIVLSGFAGASIAAELGTMVTSEEIEALESLALNPIRFLVVPRMLATVLMTIMLTVIADVVMIVGGMLTSLRLGIDPNVYYSMSLDAVNITGFLTGLVKAGVFGMLIGLIACYLGLSVKPWQGSEGVGKATTNTVVYCIVAIIGADAIFTIIFYAHGLFN